MLNNKQGNRVFLLLEFCENGNLYNYLRKQGRTGKGLDNEQAARIFLQVFEAVNYMHEMDFLHRDIKPENILLDKEFNAKICDFGWATRMEKNMPARTASVSDTSSTCGRNTIRMPPIPSAAPRYMRSVAPSVPVPDRRSTARRPPWKPIRRP